MRYVWVTDIHITPYNLQLCEKVFEKILETIIEHGCRGIIITGDVYCGKNLIYSQAQNLFFEFVRSHSLSGTEVIILPGNHDLYHVKSFRHALEPLRSLENVTIVDPPEPFIHEKTNSAFIPYLHDKNLMLKAINKCKGVANLFIHDGVNGAKIGNSHTDDFSFESTTYKSFNNVFSGHYHGYQTVDNITFLGTPFSQSFSEANKKSYIGVIDFEQGAKLLKIPTNLRRHIELYFDLSKEEIDRRKIEKALHNPDNIVKIKLRGNTKQLQAGKKIKYGPEANIQLVLVSTEEKLGRLDVKSDSAEDVKITDYMSAYVKHQESGLSAEKLIKLGKKLLEDD